MDDLISRQAAIDALADYIHNVDRVIGTGHLSADDCKDAAISVLADLPSAQPKPGKWKFTKYYFWECSRCKKNPTKGFGYVQGKDELFDFCPNCGAKMVIEEGEEE